MFGLETGVRPAGPLPPVFAGPQLHLATARGALTLLVQALAPATVWLPSYLCPVVVPCCGGRERFFPVDHHLGLTELAWLDLVQKGDIVVFIDYFGFRTWDHIAIRARARGAWIVEDASQAFLNGHFSPEANYVITSPRKFVGVPDGSILLGLRGALPATLLPPAPAEWWFNAFRASSLRRSFDLAGGERVWFDLFRRTEAEGPVAAARMSELSQTLLTRAVDWEDCARRRRANYLFLARELHPIALFPELPDFVVPLGFPVALRRREAVREALFAKEIFPPVHWPLGSTVPVEFEASHELARDILTLPSDQRYNRGDLERVVACVLAAGELADRDATA